MNDTEVYRHQVFCWAALQGVPPCGYLLLLSHKLFPSQQFGVISSQKKLLSASRRPSQYCIDI
jgi:hypothetical protein